MTEPQHTAESDAPAYRVGAQPPYSVTHIDHTVCGGHRDAWHVMGTVDGNPRNPQGPIAVCEYEPSAHAIAYLLNSTVDGHVSTPNPAPRAVEHSEPCVWDDAETGVWWECSACRRARVTSPEVP